MAAQLSKKAVLSLAKILATTSCRIGKTWPSFRRNLPCHLSPSLLSLLISNIITSAVNKHATPLQVALGVYNHRKMPVKNMHDYHASCSYEEVLWAWPLCDHVGVSGCPRSQALHRPSHTRHSHHAGSGVGCVMYTLEGTKRSSGPAGNLARNGRRTA